LDRQFLGKTQRGERGDEREDVTIVMVIATGLRPANRKRKKKGNILGGKLRKWRPDGMACGKGKQK